MVGLTVVSSPLLPNTINFTSALFCLFSLTCTSLLVSLILLHILVFNYLDVFDVGCFYMIWPPLVVLITQ